MASESDAEVVWKGSPLYGQLQDLGLLDDVAVEERKGANICPQSPSKEPETTAAAALQKDGDYQLNAEQESALLSSVQSFMWPSEDGLVLEVDVARSVLESELLVQEDEEFLSNFILNEELLTEYQRHLDEKQSGDFRCFYALCISHLIVIDFLKDLDLHFFSFRDLWLLSPELSSIFPKKLRLPRRRRPSCPLP